MSWDIWFHLWRNQSLWRLKKKTKTLRDVIAVPIHSTRDQVLSLWSGSTDSKTLHYQRTNPRGYQIVRTHRKETTVIQDLTSPNHQQYPVQDASSKQQTKQKYKLNHQQTGLSPHLTLPIRERIKKQQKLSTNLTLCEAYTNHWTNLRRVETKRKKEFNLLQEKNSTFLEAWEKETSNTVS